MKISVVIITYNEEHNIGRCLQAIAGIADEGQLPTTARKNGGKAGICAVIFFSLSQRFLDGYAGYPVCRYPAFATRVKYSKLKQYTKAGKTVYCNNEVQATVLPAPQTTI